jgi:dipeptidase E
MLTEPKLFLYSLALSSGQAASLTELVGKASGEISFALIENAADVIPNSKDWLDGFRNMLRINGYQLELIDLRKCNHQALSEKLAAKDVIWLGGGNTYYLRWILKETGADEIIRKHVMDGKVYAGWSAGSVVAGPTLQFFDTMDNIMESPEIIMDGLHLTEIVVVPHLDNKEFSEDAKFANHQLLNAGYQTVLLKDNEALIITGKKHRII